MRLEEIFDTPIPTFIHLERYVNDGSPSGFTGQRGVSPAYAPRGPAQDFEVPVLLMPNDDVVSFGDMATVRRLLGAPPSCTPIPVHPDILPEIRAVPGVLGVGAISIRAQPTASERTLLTAGPQPICLKLHYPRLIGRFRRDMPLFKWLGAQDSGRFLRDYLRRRELIGIFDEPAGAFVFHGSAGFGTIFRSLPLIGDNEALVPAFSLFARDRRAPEDPSLLEQLVRAERLTPAWFCDELVRPLLKAYVELSTAAGLIPECNAQNLVVSLAAGSPKVRWHLRDMEDVWKDVTVRQARGLESYCVPYHTIDLSTDADYFQRRSFLFDFKLGEYLLGPLVEAAAPLFAVPTEALVAEIRSLSRDLWSATPGYFASEDIWYGYPDVAEVSRATYVAHRGPQFR
jgi:hypothetical protein